MGNEEDVMVEDAAVEAEVGSELLVLVQDALSQGLAGVEDPAEAAMVLRELADLLESEGLPEAEMDETEVLPEVPVA